MKYSPEIYARAFWEAKPDAKKFLSVVHKNGDAHRLDKIVEALERYAAHQHGGRMVTMEFARVADTELVKKLQEKFTGKDHIRTTLNPALVAGVRVTIDGEQELDVSFQRKINNLWHTK